MSVLPFLPPRSSKDATATAVRAFESETAEVIALVNPYVERSMVFIFGAMVVLILLLMAVVHVDRVVTAPGRIISMDGSLVVQPLEKSIIRGIKVGVGDIVKKGQVLATLDPTFAAADLAQLTQRGESLRAEIARLEAEHDSRPYDGTEDGPYGLLQTRLWRQRQSEYQSATGDFDERIASAEAQLKRMQQDVDHYRQRLGLANDIESMRTELEKRQVGSRLNSLVAKDNRVELDRNLVYDENSINSTQHDLEALKAQREVYLQQWRSKIAQDLVDRHNEYDGNRDMLSKAQKYRDLVNLEAPDDAVVLSVANVSAGSVLQEAQALFTLVPLNAALEAEVEIDSQDTGFVQPGDKVEVKLDAYRFIEHGTAKGIVKTISRDSFTQDTNGTVRSPYFKARIALTDVKLRKVPDSFRLIPGMTLVGDIMVGKRTILSYLLSGAMKTGSEAMREP